MKSHQQKNQNSPFYDQLVKVFPRWIHPNHMTIAGGICAVLSCFALFNDQRWAAFFLYTAYHMLDNMDGKHARRTAQSSEFGAILDHFVDGTAGIWGGVVGLQYAIKVDQYYATFGLICFTSLFYIVHFIHAFSGFFEIGNDLVSVDEAFIFLSFVFLIHALDIHIAILENPICHQIFIAAIIAMCVLWIVLHASKVKLGALKNRWFVALPGVIYYGWLVTGGFDYCLNSGEKGQITALLAFVVPYACVLWESKDKH